MAGPSPQGPSGSTRRARLGGRPATPGSRAAGTAQNEPETILRDPGERRSLPLFQREAEVLGIEGNGALDVRDDVANGPDPHRERL